MHLYFCNYAILLLFQSDIPVFTTPEPRCNDFDVRLANMSLFLQDGNLVAAGNIETCLNGSYFSICDTDWDDVEAQLICNSLGYFEPFFRKFMMLGHLTTHIVANMTNIYHYMLFIIPSPGGVAVLGLIPTSQLYFDNVMCPSNAASVSDCSIVSPPTSPRCVLNPSAAGVQCIQGM